MFKINIFPVFAPKSSHNCLISHHVICLFAPSSWSGHQAGPVLLHVEWPHLPPQVQCDGEAQTRPPEVPRWLFPRLGGRGCSGRSHCSHQGLWGYVCPGLLWLISHNIMMDWLASLLKWITSGWHGASQRLRYVEVDVQGKEAHWCMWAINVWRFVLFRAL